VSALGALASAQNASHPNIILMMADDLGYGDTGFNGNRIIQTPNLDSLAQRGTILTHFYAGDSVCSSTRATCLTGRHHDRMGIWTANAGHLPKQEITLARVLKSKGYATGHFGKWHLGTLSQSVSAKGKKRRPKLNFAPPWERDYDASFVTESAIRLWDPGLGKRAKDNPFYENGRPVPADDPSLKGGASRVVVDRMEPFVRTSIRNRQPFFAVCWFHAPHQDVQAGPKYLRKYPGYGEAAHYYGCITEMDDQVGRIANLLDETGVAANTLIFFCSDNGPEGRKVVGRTAGVTDGLRGRKRALYDGGVRVPAFVVWPGKIAAGGRCDSIMSTLDYFPTIAKVVGYQMPDARPLDGEDVMPILFGKISTRDKSIPFRYGRDNSSLVKGQFKLLLPSNELYDLSKDRSEKNDLAELLPGKVVELKNELLNVFDSIKSSHAGADYNESSFKPVDNWRPLNTTTDAKSLNR
jgi:arylsulfatase A-like enzyme